jgi:DNA modification methylase
MRDRKSDVEKIIYPRSAHLEYAEAVTPKENKTEPIHNWFAFRHAFGPNLVSDLVDAISLRKEDKVLDPFCGSGTSLLACKEKEISATGLDILPLSVFITNVKLREYSPIKLRETLDLLLVGKEKARGSLPQIPIVDKGFSPAMRGEILLLKNKINSVRARKERDFFMLALLSILEKFSKTSKDGAFLRLVNDRKLYRKKLLPTFARTSLGMIRDIENNNGKGSLSNGRWTAHRADARNIPEKYGLFNAIITSPPYLNRHDYTRIYSLELAVGFVKSHNELKKLRYNTLCSHVEARPNTSEKEFDASKLLRETLQKIHKKDLNNPRVYKMIEGYFTDMFQFLKSGANVLETGGHLVLVIGNVRFAGISIPVDQILVQLAEQAGLRYKDIWTVRLRGNSPQQMKKFGKISSSENVVFLRKSSRNKGS